MARWDPRNLPSQAGKTFVVTGGSSGIGYFAAEQLAGAGARVIVAARSEAKADAAASAIRSRTPDADVGFVKLDLGSLDSVRAAAAELNRLDRIDGLLENAAVILAGRKRRLTADGHELTFGTNHLDHFALTALVFPTLARTPGSRIVTMGSGSTRLVTLRADDLQSEKRYTSFSSYALSKHATQAFGFELDRRLRPAESPVTALVAHPGGAQDGLTPFRAGVNEPSVAQRFLAGLSFVAGGSKEAAAWPLVRAAIDPDAVGGQYWGRTSPIFGRPVLNAPVASSHSAQFGEGLWSLSENWTGIPFPL
ncbi:MAG: SDR family NAD(P)-dependent oxidoreductase [Cryobacterium sp.]|nr:SDR family NAD(P)-dependent oxidoreductase [Cryobacterium sp.]